MYYNLNSDNSSGTLPQGRKKVIVIVGATGALGQRIAAHLLRLNAHVIAVVRKNSNAAQMASLVNAGIVLKEVDFDDPLQLTKACAGADCIVSAVSGLEDVIVDLQIKLMKAAISAGVPRFIPSDYCIDYTKLAYGGNRNLDLRKRFNEQLDKAPLAATSVLNGMFTNLLTGQAPVILFGLKRVVYWGNADQLLDFTTLQNTAEYTACAALDEATPRYLRIAGDVLNAKGLKDVAGLVTGKTFRLMRAGSLNRLHTIATITRTMFPKKNDVFPPWQGMQYLHDMFTGKPKLTPLDNDRYPGIQWTTVSEILSKRETSLQGD
jgi:hypothetical protein